MGFSVTTANGIAGVQVYTGSISGTGQTITATSGGSVLIEVSGTFSGTVSVQGGIDASAFGVYVGSVNGASPLAYQFNSITTGGLYKVQNPAGYSTITVSGGTWTSGTANITINVADAANIIEPVQLNPANLLGTMSQGGSWNVGQTGTWNINNITGTVSLPTGASTSALQTTGNTSLSTIATTLTLAQGSTTSGQTGALTLAAVTTAAPSYTTAQTSPLSLTTAGALRIDGSGSTQPISGTITANQGGTWTAGRTWTLSSGTDSVAAAQSGTWNINNISGTVSLPTGAATESTLSTLNGKVPSGLTVTSTRLLVDGSGVTQPVSGTVTANQGGSWTVAATQSGTWNVNNVSGTVSLPTGAATSANQTTEITSLQLIDNVIGSGPGAGTAATNSALIGGVFNTTLPTVTNGQQVALQTDSSGRLLTNSVVTLTDGTKTTYSAAINALASAATATDIFTIKGSGTKTIRVLRIEISSTQTLAATANVLLIKRSAANTGGTSTTPTGVPHDSGNAAATAVVNAYTANPSGLGAAVGTVRTIRIDVPATGSLGSTPIQWNFGDLPGQCIVLRGTAELLAVNLNSVTLGGGTFDISVMWTEE